MSSAAGLIVVLCLAAAAAAPEAGAEAEPIAITPEFTAVVATAGGLWPEIHAVGGELIVLAFNAPGHTNIPGDIDCWVSGDGGRSWTWRATAAPRPAPDANWCDASSGVAANGDLILFTSGYGDATNEHGRRTMLTPGFFRSSDAGRTWRQAGHCPPCLPTGLAIRPYGPIVQAADGTLRASVYGCALAPLMDINGWIMVSADDGYTWRPQALIAAGFNESALLQLGPAEWLCAGRLGDGGDPVRLASTVLYRSLDDGASWEEEQRVTETQQHPAHLLALADGRILLTYGNRQNHEIWAKLSSDGGRVWSAPLRIFATAPGDMGYPMTLQRPDGSLVTVFYAHNSTLHEGYHTGAVGWTLPAVP